MTDFESTASAAVTKLQEIDEIVTKSTAQYEQAENHIKEIDNEINETSISIMAFVDKAIEGINSAKDKQASTVESLKERINSIKDAVSKAQQVGETEIDEIQGKIDELTTLAGQVQETLKNQLESMVSALAELKSGFDTAQDSETEIMNSVTRKVEEVNEDAEELINDIKEKADGVMQYVEQELQNGIQEQVENMQEQVDEMKTQFETRLDAVSSEVSTSAQDTMDQVSTEVDTRIDEAKSAISTCRTAGIRTVMITGDQQATAAEIARQLGIDRDLKERPLRTVHGRELIDLDAAGWKLAVADTAVFARVSPQHKLQIVEAMQQQGQVVAMTGDGVNDAPALKKADIGIAMGIKGTEVAKENADMVITDDNFASIVGAVEQGRIIYGNILRFLHYLLSCNFSEIMTVFLALMIGWPLPLVALQILWLNLITDIFPAFALALEPSAPDVMKRPPRDPQESLLTPSFVGLVVWQGLLLTGVTLLAFGIGMNWHGAEGDGLRAATTMAFMTLALAQIFHVFNARSQRRSAFTDRLFTNSWLWAAVAFCLILQVVAVYMPLLQKVLHTAPPSMVDWGVIAGCSLLPVAVVELVKVIQRFSSSSGRKAAQ